MYHQPQRDFIPHGAFHAFDNLTQVGGIRFSIIEGRRLQEIFPQIGDDYQNGLSCHEIALKYGLYSEYPTSAINTVGQIIRYALKGYAGEIEMLDLPHYPWLLAPTQYQAAAKDVYEGSRSAIGKKNWVDGKGIHALSTEQRREIGKRSWLAQHARGIGIHAQTAEEKKELGRLGAISQGKIPWTDQEEKRMMELASQIEFQRKTRIHAQKIAKVLNLEFHAGTEARDNISVKRKLFRMKDAVSSIMKDSGA